MSEKAPFLVGLPPHLDTGIRSSPADLLPSIYTLKIELICNLSAADHGILLSKKNLPLE